ncbi:methyl-accepting chemotaxis protein [Helicobacter ailurogastricus]|uniref:methyl-accepting chemotaxis protein n=1 Tax=Helicobacter ailurogastricus TaxID=1578720 RepID=UPI000CF0FC57|nr:methyl-accepting chemotaxis protein [Helicobacter ailurogastricus]
MSFKTKISLVFAVLLLLTSVAIAGIISYRLHFRIKTSVQQNLQETVQMLSYPLKDWSNSIKVALLKTATQLEKMDLNDSKAINSFLSHVEYGMDSAIYVGFEDKRTIKPTGGVPDNYDPRTRDWYKDAKTSRGVAIGHPYLDRFTNLPVVSYSIAIYQKGVFQGVLGADISLANVEAIAKKYSTDQKRIYFFDRQGFILGSHVLKQGKRFFEVFPKTRSISQQILNGSSGLIESATDGVDKYYAYTTVPGPAWKVLAVCDRDFALKDLSIIQHTILFVSIVALVLCLASFFVVVQILFKPLVTLTRLIQALLSKEGDLTERVVAKGNDEIATISRSINAFLEKTHGIISTIKSNSTQNTQIARTLQDSSTTVSDNAKEEQDRIQAVVRDGESVVTNILSGADNATANSGNLVSTSHALEKVRGQIEAFSKDLGDNAHLSVEYSNKLERASHETQQIKAVLTIISDIADQTNLLALNAAIEAARAGEHGRGFAVVADEVRKLAEKTQSSLNEINSTITSVVQNVDSISKDLHDNAQEIVKISQVAHDLRKVVDSNVQGLQSIISTIIQDTQSFKEMAQLTKNIMGEIQEIGALSISNQKSVQAVAQASVSLSKTADVFDHELNKFKV